MKIGGIWKLSLLVISCTVIYNAYTLNQKNSLIAYSDITQEYDLDNGIKKIIYKNTTSHQITLTRDNIVVECKGSNYKDEKLVKENLFLRTTFKSNNNISKNKIDLNKRESATIYIRPEYKSDTYPIEKVECDYKVSVNVQ